MSLYMYVRFWFSEIKNAYEDAVKFAGGFWSVVAVVLSLVISWLLGGIEVAVKIKVQFIQAAILTTILTSWRIWRKYDPALTKHLAVRHCATTADHLRDRDLRYAMGGTFGKARIFRVSVVNGSLGVDLTNVEVKYVANNVGLPGGLTGHLHQMHDNPEKDGLPDVSRHLTSCSLSRDSEKLFDLFQVALIDNATLVQDGKGQVRRVTVPSVPGIGDVLVYEGMNITGATSIQVKAGGFGAAPAVKVFQYSWKSGDDLGSVAEVGNATA